MKISVSNIKNLVNEAIEEAKLGKGGAFKAQPQVTTGAQGNTKDPNEGKFFPRLSYCFVKNDGPNGEAMYHIGLNYVYSQHADILKRFYEKTGKGFSVIKDNGRKDAVELDVPEQNIDLFKKYLPLTAEVLKKAATLTRNTKYDEKAIQGLADDIIKGINTAPNSEELKAYYDSVSKSWKEMMDKVNDPAIQQRLKNLGAYVPSGSNEFDSIDYQMSDETKAIALAQDPNATYITQEAGWKRLNREIIDPSKFIIVPVPSHKMVTKDVRERAATALGYGTYDAFKKMKRQGLITKGRQHKFDMKCQYLSSDKYFMYPVKMYDIANTRVMPGMEDYFETEERFINNLFGLPNDFAIKNKKKTDQDIEAYKKANPQTQVTTARTETMLANALFLMIRACRNYGITFSESGNVAEDIGAAVYRYEYQRAKDEYKMPRAEDIKLFAESVAAAVSVSLGIENAILKNFYSQRGTMSDDQAQKAFGDFLSITNAMSSEEGRKSGNRGITQLQMVVEGMGQKNYNWFVNFLETNGIQVVPEKQIGNELEEEVIDDKEENSVVKESFYKFLDKIEML